MATTSGFRLLTPRDSDILAALDYCPLTALQLLKFSQTFAAPFPSERRVRDRLLQMCDAGWVRRWQYATASRGAPNYYRLSPTGFRLLHGDKAIAPSKRAFDRVGLARQHHTQSLADFIVHTAVAAHESGVLFADVYRENSLRLQIGEESLFPDIPFQLISPDRSEFSFFTEIDAGSERIRSPKDLDSWERKIRLYDRLQDMTPKRFRVLIISTRSTERLDHILDAAATLATNPQRSLFYGVALPHYLSEADALRSPCFRDHRGNSVSLLPVRPIGRSATSAYSPLNHSSRLSEASPPLRGAPSSALPSLPT